jgi:hypothetical protein
MSKTNQESLVIEKIKDAKREIERLPLGYIDAYKWVQVREYLNLACEVIANIKTDKRGGEVL